MHIKQKVRDKRGKNPLFSRLGERTDIINNDNRQARLPPDIWRCNLVQKKLFLRAFSAFFFFRKSRASLVSLRRSTPNFSERRWRMCKDSMPRAPADMLYGRANIPQFLVRNCGQYMVRKKGEVGAAWQRKGKDTARRDRAVESGRKIWFQMEGGKETCKCC